MPERPRTLLHPRKERLVRQHIGVRPAEPGDVVFECWSCVPPLQRADGLFDGEDVEGVCEVPDVDERGIERVVGADLDGAACASRVLGLDSESMKERGMYSRERGVSRTREPPTTGPKFYASYVSSTTRLTGVMREGRTLIVISK